MTAPSPTASRLTLREGRETDRLLGQLAHALASSGPGCGLVIEQTIGSNMSRLVVRPSTLLDEVEPGLRTRASRPGPLFSPEATLPKGYADTFGVLLPRSPPPSPPRALEGRRWTIPSLPAPFDPGGARGETRTYWVPRATGGIWAARLYRLISSSTGSLPAMADVVGAVLAQHWSTVLGRPCTSRRLGRWSARHAWKCFSSDAAPKEAWTAIDAELASASADLPRPALSIPAMARTSGHLAVFGSSGAGKTSLLAELASESVRRGESVVVLDLHGDLTTGITERLAPALGERIMAVDVTDPPVPGIDVLAAPPGEMAGERSVVHLVSALKRLSPDGEQIYWGFRLERVFDSFLRLIQEEGGSLVDLVAALQSPARREALRAGTRRPELARFLDELSPIFQRHPDILWPAAARLAKVVLAPALRQLLAPVGEEWPWATGLRSGRSLLVRLPFAEIGSEAAALASTLLLARIYLAHAASVIDGEESRPFLLFLDEAQAFSPRLLAEILSEGRKYGVRVVVSTQYPQRLASEVEHALRGTVATHACLRVPLSGARSMGEWLGLGSSLGAEELAALPTGTAVVVGRRIDTVTTPRPPGTGAAPVAWRAAVQRTRAEAGAAFSSLEVPYGSGVDELDPPSEALLLAVFAAHEAGVPFTEADVVRRAGAHLADGGDPAQLADRWTTLVRRHWVLPETTGWSLGSAGAERLGLGRKTGATRESAEHRALLLQGVRLFARRGYRLEILRQGRFDTLLPDARLELLPAGRGRFSPGELAQRVDQARAGWAWRFFHGRNVHVEAEVSGALRAERIRHGCRKAAREGAFVLFLVSDAWRARRVRAVLREMGLDRSRAQVWTLREALSVRPTSRTR